MEKQTAILTQQYKRKSIVRVDITYVSEDAQGNEKEFTSKFDGDDYGAIIMDQELKDALHKLMGPKICHPDHSQPPNSHKPMMQNAADDAPPECCYYVDGQWYCW